MWALGFARDTGLVTAYEEEWKVRAGDLVLWLPVQAETATSMRSFAKKGTRITIWYQWFGAVRRDGVTSWVFPVMRTQTH